MNNRDLIFITNDDGYNAKGLKVLHDVAKTLSNNIWSFAPLSNNSGKSHSITINKKIKTQVLKKQIYKVDGTPVDCVIIGVKYLSMKKMKPNIILSGVNHGQNLGLDVLYSGTVAAAREGSFQDIKSFSISLEKNKEPSPEALVESAVNNIKLLEDEDFLNFKISVKSSDVFLSTKAYRSLSKICSYPLHLGITEAGGLTSGSIKSSIGMGMLLMEGIGDTIRVSLSANPVEEVKVGYEILKSLNLRHKGVNIISCPSCARQGFPVIDTVKILEEKLSHIKEPITLSVIGCVVNGPGEASQTQIGLTGGGKGDHMMYISGLPHHKVASNKIIDEVVSLVEKKSKELKNN